MLFDVELRADRGSRPFARQFPIFNWYYPLNLESSRVNNHLDALEQVDWYSARRRAAYFHVPFCDTICTFCPFVRGGYSDGQEVQTYVDALVKEVQLKRPFVGKVAVDSVFIGGGSPSVLTPKQIAQLGDCLETYFEISEMTEFTAEAEVKSITREKLTAFRNIGVNRISFGVQTFSQPHREAFNLTGDVAALKRKVEWAKEMFPYTNVDMIYGIAGQQVEDAVDDAVRAVALGTTTIDFYPLNNVTAQPRMHRELRKRGLLRPGAQARLQQRQSIDEYMSAEGYRRISGYGYASKADRVRTMPQFLYHDILYGYYDDVVIGYGPAALTRAPGFNFDNVTARRQYHQLLLERNLLPIYAFRTGACEEKGIVTFPYRGTLDKSRIRWAAVPLDTLGGLESLIRAGLVEDHTNAFALTETGWLFYVNIMYVLMPHPAKSCMSSEIAASLDAGHECENTELTGVV